VCTDFKILKVKVPIIFFGTQGWTLLDSFHIAFVDLVGHFTRLNDLNRRVEVHHLQLSIAGFLSEFMVEVTELEVILNPS
jgi:hypothetical protein